MQLLRFVFVILQAFYPIVLILVLSHKIGVPLYLQLYLLRQ
nr:MAG TPA: hypothetical protein [Bacteriophage sp.]